MKKAFLTAAIIASLGTASAAQGIQPVMSTQTPDSLRGLGAGSLAGGQIATLAAILGISVIALIAILDDGADGTN